MAFNISDSCLESILKALLFRDVALILEFILSDDNNSFNRESAVLVFDDFGTPTSQDVQGFER